MSYEKILLALLCIILIHNAYAQIQTSSSVGTLQVENAEYEIKSHEITLVKIFGTINNVMGDQIINIAITSPSGLTDGVHATPTSNGYFETYWIIDKKSPIGQYKVLASYQSAQIGQITFQVKEKEYSEEELLSAREILDKIKEEKEVTEEKNDYVAAEIENFPLLETQELSEIDKSKIETYTKKADEYFENENYPSSRNFYSRVLEIESENLHALNRIGLIYLYTDYGNKAMTYFDKIIDIDPNHAKAYYNKGQVYESKNQILLAVENFDKAINIEPDNMGFVVGKGIVLYLHNRHTHAIIEFDKVLSIEPNNIDALNVKALTLSDRDKNNDQFDALLAINKVLEQDSQYPDAVHNQKDILNEIGMNYDSDHEFDKAIEYYDMILERDSFYIDALNNKAKALYQMEFYDEAIEYFDKALSINPNFVIALTGKGTVLNDLGHYDEAMILFDKALRIDPSSSTAQQNKQFSLQEILKIKKEIQEQQQVQTTTLIIAGVIIGAILIGILVWYVKFRPDIKNVQVKQKQDKSKNEMKWEGI